MDSENGDDGKDEQAWVLEDQKSCINSLVICNLCVYTFQFTNVSSVQLFLKILC